MQYAFPGRLYTQNYNNARIHDVRNAVPKKRMMLGGASAVIETKERKVGDLKNSGRQTIRNKKRFVNSLTRHRCTYSSDICQQREHSELRSKHC